MLWFIYRGRMSLNSSLMKPNACPQITIAFSTTHCLSSKAYRLFWQGLKFILMRVSSLLSHCEVWCYHYEADQMKFYIHSKSTMSYHSHVYIKMWNSSSMSFPFFIIYSRLYLLPSIYMEKRDRFRSLCTTTMLPMRSRNAEIYKNQHCMFTI